MNQLEKKWYKNFLLLKDFVIEKGRFPYRTEMYKGIRLGEWMQTQHKNMESLDLTQLKCLKSINFPSKQMTYSEKLDYDWKKNLQLLEVYLRENNNQEPTAQTVYNDIALGKWFEKIKRDYMYGRMDPEKVQDLKDRNIIITNELEKNWLTNFERLKEFVEVHQRMPAKRDMGHRLGVWIDYQLKKIQEGRLLEWQYNLLEGIGIFKLEPEVHAQRWDEMFGYYKQFYDLNGRNPRKCEKYDQHTVGEWFLRQQKYYAQNNLVKRRIKLILSVSPNAFDNLLLGDEGTDKNSDNQ